MGQFPFIPLPTTRFQATKLRQDAPDAATTSLPQPRGELNSSKTRSFKSASICQEVVQWGTKRLISCSFASKLGYFIWIYLDLKILKIHQEFCVVIHKGCSTDHNNFSAPTHLQTYLLYHKKDDNGRILGPFTNYFWEFAEKLQEFCEDNVAMRQLCRKHEKLQMPRW